MAYKVKACTANAALLLSCVLALKAQHVRCSVCVQSVLERVCVHSAFKMPLEVHREIRNYCPFQQMATASHCMWERRAARRGALLSGGAARRAACGWKAAENPHDFALSKNNVRGGGTAKNPDLTNK